MLPIDVGGEVLDRRQTVRTQFDGVLAPQFIERELGNGRQSRPSVRSLRGTR